VQAHETGEWGLQAARCAFGLVSLSFWEPCAGLVTDEQGLFLLVLCRWFALAAVFPSGHTASVTSPGFAPCSSIISIQPSDGRK
jgi:hypothetical protein